MPTAAEIMQSRQRSAAAALRAFISYLVLDPSVQTSIADLINEPKAIEGEQSAKQSGRKVSIDRKTFDKFMKPGSKSNAVDNYASILAVTQEWVNQNADSIMAEYRPVARLAGITFSESYRIRPHSLPEFIDARSLVPDGRFLSTAMNAVGAYEGCWRTYRLDTHDKTKLSVGLLNVRPWAILQEEHLLLPRFSFRQISQKAVEEKRWNDLSRMHGIMTYSDRRVTLLGWREENDHTVRPAAGIFTWQDANPRRYVHERFIEGISLIPNSDGSNVIGSYFVADYIDGSEKLDHKGYLAFINQEVTQLGSKTIDTIKQNLRLSDRTDLILRLDKLVNNSASHVVLFQERAE